MGRKRDHLSSNTSRPDSTTKRTLTCCHACLRRASLAERPMIALENEHFPPAPPLCALLLRKTLSPLPDAHGPLVRLGRTCCFAQRLHDVGVTVVEEAERSNTSDLNVRAARVHL